MKKIFLLATAAIIVLASCTKTQIIETPADQKAISFENFLHKTTKATIVTIDNIGDLALRAYLKNNTENVASEYINGDLIKSGSVWNTATTYYWPSSTWGTTTTATLNFFSFYPIDGPTWDLNGYTGNTASKPILTYNIQDLAADQKDIVAASAENQTYTTNTTTNGQVALTFNHLLSQVNFAARGDVARLKYNVTAVTIGAVKNQGTYTFGGNMAPISSSTSQTYTYPMATGVDFTVDDPSTDDYKALGTDNLMLLPQTETPNVVISVTYSVTDPSNGDAVIFASATKTVTITSLTWAQGKNYKYQLTLPSGAKQITYSVKVNDWIDETVSTTVNL